MTDSERLQHYHDKGEKDWAKREYNPPHELPPVIEELSSKSPKEIADREAYRKGYRNARNQQK